MTRIVSIAVTAGLSRGGVEEFVAHIASQNPYNPVAEWIESIPWDGTSRLKAFYDTVGTTGDNGFKETLLKRWMISAVAAAFRPSGVSAHGVLTFRADQYLGKTAWFKRLVPQTLKVTRDGMLLDPKDKDSVYQVVCNWLVELGEVDATFRKADIAQLKAFITKDQDTIRLPYAHFPATFARRTVFFASVNDKHYLSDPTGNRRFWTIDCDRLDHDHQLDMQQVWAEFYALYKHGEPFYLTAEEMTQLNEHNKDFEAINPIEEKMRSKYDWAGLGNSLVTPRRKTLSEIADEIAVQHGQRELRAISKALKDLGGITVEKSHGQRLYRVPHMKVGVGV